MPEITNAVDWWDAVDIYWDALRRIITDQISSTSMATIVPGDRESLPTGRTVAAEIEHLKKTRDTRLVRYFHAAWGLASESYAWSVPGWGVLCDLCSEEWALDDESRIETKETVNDPAET